MSEFEKEAEAVKAVAELGTESLKTIQKAGGFFRDIIGDGLHDWAALKFSDRQKFKRAAAVVYDYDNIIRIAHKVDQKLLRDGVTTRAAIAPKLGIEFLNHASLEYDDNIQELYAELYASAVNPDKKEQVEVKHIHTLKSLTGGDLRTLKVIFAERMWLRDREQFHLEKARLKFEWVEASPKTANELAALIEAEAINPLASQYPYDKIAIESLMSAGIIQPMLVDLDKLLNTKSRKFLKNKRIIRGSAIGGELTSYGLEFCKITKPEIRTFDRTPDKRPPYFIKTTSPTPTAQAR